MTVYQNLINISRLTDDHTSLILFTSGCCTIQISRRRKVKMYKANQHTFLLL